MVYVCTNVTRAGDKLYPGQQQVFYTMEDCRQAIKDHLWEYGLAMIIEKFNDSSIVAGMFDHTEKEEQFE